MACLYVPLLESYKAQKEMAYLKYGTFAILEGDTHVFLFIAVGAAF